MTLQLIFWVCMLVTLILGVRVGMPGGGPRWAIGLNALTFVLFLILGWAVFGAPVQT